MPIKILKLFSSPPWRRGQGEEGIKFPLLLGGEGRVRRERARVRVKVRRDM